MEVTGMSLRWWHRLRQRLRISSCNHGQWIVLQRAENLWCGGWLALEFYRSRKKPDDLCQHGRSEEHTSELQSH